MYYHVWFVTKYRKLVLESKKLEKETKDSFAEVAHNKNYNILEMETNRDHAHMLLEARNREELASMVRILKCVSAKKILQNTPYLRMGNARHLWARRYGWKEIGENEIEGIREYIRDQKRMPTRKRWEENKLDPTLTCGECRKQVDTPRVSVGRRTN